MDLSLAISIPAVARYNASKYCLCYILSLLQRASLTNRGQQENINLITVINLVEQTMTILSKYREHLKTRQDFNLTQQAM